MLRKCLVVLSKSNLSSRYVATHKSVYPEVFCRLCSSDSKDMDKKSLVRLNMFHEAQEKDRKTYLELIEVYKSKNQLRYGHVEFIYAAMKHMKEFGVEKDLEVYKSLIDVFPKGKLIPKNFLQAEFMHYPKHQQCAIDLLEKMEENAVMPDSNMEDQLLNVFGSRGYPLRRYWRMMYWMPKFKNASPWPLPSDVPTDSYQLALMAIKRIMSVDVLSEVNVYKTSDVKDSVDDTWIVSGQSPDQRRLLSELPAQSPVYVEGGFRIYLRNQSVTYFVLRADAKPPPKVEDDPEDLRSILNPLFAPPDPKTIALRRTVHEQDDSTILAVSASGTSSRDSMLSWVRMLEKSNPNLANLVVLFPSSSPFGQTEAMPEQLTSRTEKLTSEPQPQIT